MKSFTKNSELKENKKLRLIEPLDLKNNFHWSLIWKLNVSHYALFSWLALLSSVVDKLSSYLPF